MFIRKLYKKIKNELQSMFFSKECLARKAGVVMGNNNEIMSRFWSSEPYLIEIGNDCQITAGVKIFTHGGAKVARIIEPRFDVFGKVKIGDNVYIGNNALIMPGVTLGSNILVAAGSVVTKSFMDNVVIGGNPAHVLSSIEEYYAKNKRYNMNTKGLNRKYKKAILLMADDLCFIKK